MNDTQIEEYGVELYRALRTATAVEPLTDRTPSITIDEAYRIQSVLNRLRVERDGERVIGKKIGVTSKAVQEMLDVHQPDFGFLLDAMQVPDGEHDLAVEARADPAARRGRDRLRADATRCRGRASPRSTCSPPPSTSVPCFEIVDSRIRDWKIAIEDTVADNASCGVFVLGADRVPPRALDLAAVRMEIAQERGARRDGARLGRAGLSGGRRRVAREYPRRVRHSVRGR